MNLAYKKILGKFTKVLGFGKTPPPCWEKFPNDIVFFLTANLRFHFVTLRTAALLITAIIFKTQSSDWETSAIRSEQVLQPALAVPGFRAHHYHSLNKHRKVRSSEQLRQRHHSKSFIIGFERKKRDTYTLKLRNTEKKKFCCWLLPYFLLSIK